MPLPSTERILLGPGEPHNPARHARDGGTVLSHLDPDFVPMLDEVRASLQRVFRADSKAFTIATSRMPARQRWKRRWRMRSPTAHGIVIVTGYFGDRLAQMFQRYGAKVRRIDVEWGRAADPQRLREELKREAADVIGIVHAENLDGRAQPGEGTRCSRARARRTHDCRHGDVARRTRGRSRGSWGVDIAYSCTQKCIGAPSGMAPIAVSGAARERLVPCRSFYLDLKLLEDYWVGRKCHHTMSSTLIYALREALLMVEEEGLAAH